MSSSQFNLLAWARKLGLKDINQARVNPNPGTMISVGDHQALTPQLRPPTALFGANLPPVALQFAQFFIQSLDPGGVIIKSLNSTSAPATIFMGMLPAGTALPVTAVPLANAGIFGEGPGAVAPASGCFTDSQVAPRLLTVLVSPSGNPLAGADTTPTTPLVMEPGRIFVVEGTLAAAMNISCILQAVPVATSGV